MNQEPGSNPNQSNNTEDKKSTTKKLVKKIGTLMLVLTLVGCALLIFAGWFLNNTISSVLQKYGM